jgi:hypothetical protein
VIQTNKFQLAEITIFECAVRQLDDRLLQLERPGSRCQSLNMDIDKLACVGRVQLKLSCERCGNVEWKIYQRRILGEPWAV